MSYLPIQYTQGNMDYEQGQHRFHKGCRKTDTKVLCATLYIFFSAIVLCFLKRKLPKHVPGRKESPPYSLTLQS